MSTILVTGGAGFIGSHFVKHWIDQEASQVVVLDKLTYAGNLASLADAQATGQLLFQKTSISDFDTVLRTLQEHQPTTLFHFAAESHVDRSIDDPSPFIATNVEGTSRLLEAARRYWRNLEEPQRSCFRFVHISSDEVYGSIEGEGGSTEQSPYAPNSPYAASKAASDHFVRAYYKTYGLPVLTSHPCNNFGPFQFPEKLIPLVILNAVEGRDIPIYGDGQQVREWMFVQDTCRALAAIAQQGTVGESYNIGGGKSLTNLELVQRICSIVDEIRPGLAHAPCSSLIQFVADRPGHDRRYATDGSKLCQQLGWSLEHKMDVALETTVRWYLDNTAWAKEVLNTNYDRQRLGLPVTIRGEVP